LVDRNETLERPLRRSLFFVPGGEPRKLEKAPGLGADTLLLDLEDSVAPAEKEQARERVARALVEGGFGGAEVAVRVNPPGTPYFSEDVEAAVLSGAHAIMLPKSESATALASVAAQIDAIERRQRAGSRRRVRLLALVETAAGIVSVGSLAAASDRIEALCFGHADFSRDMGLARADASVGSLFHARCALAIAARAARISPVDTVHLDPRDEKGFRADAELGAGLGFEGKLCIHPSQIAIANAVHTPTAEQIDFARRVVEAALEAESEGRGVFTVDGKMVDAPLIAAQQRILEKARRAGAAVDGGGASDES